MPPAYSDGVSEGVLPVAVHMRPAHRTDRLDSVGQVEVFLALRILQEVGSEAGVEVDDVVGQQARILAPALPFQVSSDPTPRRASYA